MKQYRVIGVMSGTSLDGLDIALCNIKNEENKWLFEIEKATTVAYENEWKEKLENAQKLSAAEFIHLHRLYGAYIGKKVAEFAQNMTNLDFVASHGHTVFHKPEEDLTFQIGCGAYIAAECKMLTISDFRTLDIALGGQGAPLVPIGDQLLFSDYDACINIGGFANISYDVQGERKAYDICPVNFVLNQLVQSEFNTAYDEDGLIGRKGCLDFDLYRKLNALDFYNQNGPKSLAREWVEKEFWPLVKQSDGPIENIITTCYHHFAQQMASVIKTNQLRNVLFTGGGSYNQFLLELISEKCRAKLVVPDNNLVEYKEALIFAFLGVLRIEEQNNCLKSVTGASKNNTGGCIYLP
ncbi:anhydro-N-acetylmuramic acid kinase [Plebeiibacterium sediminum]|uniref:Anhydro-N-acetylmuramic acid kinase n=1 Tax=Plebeiibacterium sediminum TaxID=2992112 RepID=A0AAE3M4I4_9BACT|nr:anhydro-N-acetylmuramic acid kinase [Plebeiobacterium sediminum]MCW3786702.1 anhydro-N-acetylmuramic acid kinase [Plebeiobacterium sediminum]